jgi:N-acetylmuramoyl-L-alanine amidase
MKWRWKRWRDSASEKAPFSAGMVEKRCVTESNSQMQIEKHTLSPNFSSRDGAVVSMLVLHYTGMKSAAAALERLCDKKAEVSAHYVIDENGAIYSPVEERHCAWHAGVSYWRGKRNVNNISIGVEIVNPGHEFGYRPFPAAQMHAAAALCKGIIARHTIQAVNVVGHSDIAPLRKTDPGELFDWQWLAGQGIGLWPETASQFSVLQPATCNLQLTAFGYEPTQGEENRRKVIGAFQRRFRPSAINGMWDAECDERLAALLKMV